MRRAPLTVLVAVAVVSLPACSGLPAPGAAPRCENIRRAAIMAQAVPTAAYVPCIAELAEGWSDRDFMPHRGQVEFSLDIGRAGTRRVQVMVQETCETEGAVPTTARAAGVRTSVRLLSITPRYAGTVFDVFAGGCVSYRFDFPRGPHIALMEQLQQAVVLLSRQQLQVALRRELDVELGP